MPMRILLIAILAAASGARADALSDAFSQGSQLGRSGNAQARQGITSDAARSTVPRYTTSPRETSYYGSGDLGGASERAIRNCSRRASRGSTLDPSCMATEFSQRNPERRPSFAIGADDPLLARSRTIANDPHSIAGNLAGTYSSCTTQTITSPDIFETRLCHQYRTAEQFSCQKALTVQVSRYESCTPGTWFGNFWVNTWGNGQVNYRWAGVAVNAYCQPADTVRMTFHAICTESPCGGSADIEVNAANGAPAPLTFTNFVGRSWYMSDYFNRVDYNGGGCSGEWCSFSFCTRYEEHYAVCDEGCWSYDVNETRACGTFSFPRPRSIFTVTDTWDNQCATLEARLP